MIRLSSLFIRIIQGFNHNITKVAIVGSLAIYVVGSPSSLVSVVLLRLVLLLLGVRFLSQAR